VFYQALEISVCHSHLFDSPPNFWSHSGSFSSSLAGRLVVTEVSLLIALLVYVRTSTLAQICEKARFGKEWKKSKAVSKAVVQFVPCAALLHQTVDTLGGWFILGRAILHRPSLQREH